MRVVEISESGGPEVLRLVDMPEPQPGPGDVVIRVAAASVNRPDIQQRRGLYPPPPGASAVLGLDVAGIVAAVGDEVTGWAVGDPVCALTNGGGYADYCLVPAPQCMTVPKGLSLLEAASLPEAYFTAWNNVIWLGRLAQGETVLVQGGASGVGLAAIQLARCLRDARVFATAGSPEKAAACQAAGAEATLDYRGDWAARLRDRIGPQGIDVVLDGQGGAYVQQHLDLLAPDGRLVMIASHQAPATEVNTRDLVRRRLTLTGSTLRPRSPHYKDKIARSLEAEVWPLLADCTIVSRIHASFPLERVREAHAVLDVNQQIGKVVLVMDAEMAASRPG